MRCVRGTHSGESVANPRMQICEDGNQSPSVSMHSCAEPPKATASLVSPKGRLCGVVTKEIDSSIEKPIQDIDIPDSAFL